MTVDGVKASLQPRLLRPAPDPLGLYIRIGRNDHAELLDLMARGDAGCFGFVFEATALERHKELRERTLATRLDAILDPRTLAAAMPGGYNAAIASLPWGADHPHAPDDFRAARGRQMVEKIAACVMRHRFTQVLAPTHVIQSSSDEWLGIDHDSTQFLREALDRNGGEHVQIVYVLAIPYVIFRDPLERRALIRALRQLPADALWLRVDGLGVAATANGLCNYIEAARDFASLNIPIVADGMGGLAGLSLLAFGVAGGIAHGVTFGERVDNGNWRRARDGSAFGPTQRIYIPELDVMLEPTAAEAFLRSSSRAHGLFACRDSQCCPRGLRDMLENPARHFLVQRMGQIARLGRIHSPLRAERFLEEHLRPATDAVVQATNLKLKDEDLLSKLNSQRKRLDAIRVALGEVARTGPRKSVATIVPQTRAARELRTSPGWT